MYKYKDDYPIELIDIRVIKNMVVDIGSYKSSVTKYVEDVIVVTNNKRIFKYCINNNIRTAFDLNIFQPNSDVIDIIYTMVMDLKGVDTVNKHNKKILQEKQNMQMVAEKYEQ